MAAQPKPSHTIVIAAMATHSPDPWSVPVRAAAPHDSSAVIAAQAATTRARGSLTRPARTHPMPMPATPPAMA